MQCPIVHRDQGRFSLKGELRFHEELEEPRVDKDALSPGLNVHQHALSDQSIQPIGCGGSRYVATQHHSGDAAVRLFEEDGQKIGIGCGRHFSNLTESFVL